MAGAEGTTFQLYSSKKSAKSGGSGKPKTILRSKSLILHIIHEGKNVTPKPLDPNIYQMTTERQLGVYDDSSMILHKDDGTLTTITKSIIDTTRSPSKMNWMTDIKESQAGSVIKGSIDVFVPAAASDFLKETEGSQMGEYGEVSSMEIISNYSTESIISRKVAFPQHVSLVLSETGTMFVLDIPSCTALKDTDEGNLAEQKNEEYIYITEGKGRNRKIVNAEAQTEKILMKSRNTEAEAMNRRNKRTFASNWEMYDTFDSSQPEVKEEEKSETESDDSETVVLRSDTSSLDSYKLAPDEKQIQKIVKSASFQEAVCVVQRLLSSNCYNEQQKRFRGLSDPDIFREKIEYKYQLKLLWTFANQSTNGKCVTALEWNTFNQDLVAVGYGKFYFTEVTKGMVYIWNIKNPVQPERMYKFANPVTTLSFSKKNPNLLAIGFYNGHVIILNVLNREIDIVGENIPAFETVWNLVWRANLDPSKDTEQICASFDDGRVIFYSIENSKELQSQQMMRVAKADGKLKGFNSMRKCSNLNIPVSRYAGARFIRWHPENPDIYLVGTNEGVVHKCSTNYLNQHLDLFLAHDGPVNDLEYCPFSNKIYATCGDDWNLRIWAEGISEPLQELYVTMLSVQSMDWSPTHSTILASIYGKTILLWDFQRKVWKPQSETQSPTSSRNTIVKFIDSGRCLVVGDIDGNVHVFALEDMPFPAFYQENLLFDSLEKSLSTNVALLAKLKKVRRSTSGNFTLK